VSPRGRRPGGADTRAAILAAARADFAEQGYDATSVRGVARRAEVDPALVHHYFGGKAKLFAAVLDIPADPAALVGAIVHGPREQVGEGLVRTFLALWDSEEGRQRFQALLRSAVTHDEATLMLREFLAREVFGRVVRELHPGSGHHGSSHTGSSPTRAPSAELELRAGLAASQMIGLAVMRYIVELPAVVEASHDELAALLGPTLQGYLVPEA
jgi:AcrR family transcriptional regulator